MDLDNLPEGWDFEAETDSFVYGDGAIIIPLCKARKVIEKASQVLAQLTQIIAIHGNKT